MLRVRQLPRKECLPRLSLKALRLNENVESNRHAQQQVGDGDVLRLAIVAASHKVPGADLPNCLFDPSPRKTLHQVARMDIECRRLQADAL